MFFYKRVRSFMSRTAITLKLKRRWFPDEAGYSAEKDYTDINLSLLMPNEDKKFGGSLVSNLENDDVTCKPRINDETFWKKRSHKILAGRKVECGPLN